MKENLEEKCRATLLLSADAPELLRAMDVDRVMSDAEDQDYLEFFRAWLLKQDLREGTRKAVALWSSSKNN